MNMRDMRQPLKRIASMMDTIISIVLIAELS